MLARLVLFALAAFFFGCGADVDAENTGSTETIVDRINEVEADHNFMRQCPADYFATLHKPFSDVGVDMERCTEMQDLCLAQCIDKKDGLSCLNLAYALQKQEGHLKLYSENMFAFACAMGSAAGCTNRVAGAAYLAPELDNDPTNIDCRIRSYKLACDQNSGWGCAMYGFELYRSADGDRAEMIRAFDRACALEPGYDSCDYATNLKQRAEEEFQNR